MLTGTQLSIVAYSNEDGELFCPDCAQPQLEGAPEVDLHGMFLHFYDQPDPEVTGLYPVIQYAIDEEQQALAPQYPEDWPGHEECLPAVFDVNGHELEPEWHDHEAS